MTKWCFLLPVVLVFAGVRAAPAVAATTGLPKFLQKELFLQSALSSRYGSVTVLRILPGPPGLTAALVSASGRKGIVWIIGNDAAVAVGDVWDAKGENLTRQMAIRAGLIEKPLAPAAVAAAAASLDTFMIGSKGPELTVFLDPNCIFCHEFYQKAQLLIRDGRLHLRVVLVGFVKPTSAAKAAAILMHRDPARALTEDEAKFDVTTEEGGISPVSAPPPAIKRAVEANTLLLSHTGDEATPTLLFQGAAGHWRIIHHLPAGGLAPILEQMSRSSNK